MSSLIYAPHPLTFYVDDCSDDSLGSASPPHTLPRHSGVEVTFGESGVISGGYDISMHYSGHQVMKSVLACCVR